MIRAGQQLTFTVSGQVTPSYFHLLFTPETLAAGVSNLLSQTFEIRTLDVRSDDTIVTGTLGWSYEAEVTVNTRGAYAEAVDVGSIIGNAFYRMAGAMPIVKEGRPLGKVPELSWKVIIGLVAVGVLVVAWKF